MKIGIYPGTFDPVTIGHVDIIKRALKVVDKLIVGVAKETYKDNMFDLSMRTKLVLGELDVLPNGDGKRVEVKPFEGLLVDFAKHEKANILIRGLRAVSDFEYEFQMAAINTKLYPDMETVFLTASEATHFISSRFVKQIAKLGGDISAFVSPRVARELKTYFEVNP
jgi:pantetheine-phosphate adenylyltransferase